MAITTHKNERDDDIGRLTDPVMRRLAAGRNRLDDPELLKDRARAAGLRFDTLGWVEDHFAGESPLGQIERIEQRNVSVLWGLGQREWDEEIAPLLAKLRALPDPDPRRMIHTQDAVLVFSKSDH